MAEYEVALKATTGIFRGLAKQNMLFHQCIGELVDNAIAATRENDKFRIEIVLIERDDLNVDLYVADNGRGMSRLILGEALQLGESATTVSRLNEHGFGMKNALATLSGGNGPWELWTRESGMTQAYYTSGPFESVMKIREADGFPDEPFVPAEVATLVRVTVKKSLMQTVQGRGRPAGQLATLRDWLVEHLGVMYRGYLEQDAKTQEESGSIYVTLGDTGRARLDRKRVPVLKIPMSSMKKTSIAVRLAGESYILTYNYGTLEDNGQFRYYYQGNISTQGIDIRLGKRVIASRQMDTIWQTARHNHFNEFVGELVVPDVPRGILTTTNSKTDFNLDDPDWETIFSALRQDYPPVRDIREMSEEQLRQEWLNAAGNGVWRGEGVD